MLPQPQTVNEGGYSVKDDALDDEALEKRPKMPGNLDSKFFDSDKSWFDAAPEGFSLTVS